MVFSSSVFLFVFLPLVVLVYFLMPSRSLKNVILLIASLIFYAWGEPVYIGLMIISILANWVFGIAIDASKDRKKLYLVLDLIVNLAILGFFKYEGFFAENVNAIAGFALVPDLELPLPIGISFYTLQAVSYIIDVYRGEVPAQRNPLYLGMYIAMFPQLVAGPIVRYSTIQDQILNRKESLSGFAAGARLFCVGLAKKVLLANVCAILAVDMLSRDPSEIGVIGAWGGLIAYTFQIFFDFSGYSDMAIGLGKMFGFEYLRNFNYPYISRSITEFWRRWHISLSSFFRDYIYIPLGGSRVTKARWMFNLFAVWFLTGFWHGAAWNYILWGLFYLCVLLFEKFFLLQRMDKIPVVLQHVYTIIVFMFGWLLFWIEDMGQMGQYFLAMFGVFGSTGTSTAWELGIWSYVPVFVVCAIASTPVMPWLRAKLCAWVQGVKLENFMKTDLPNPKMLETGKLCDWDRYIPASVLATLPKNRVNIYAAAMVIVDLSLLVLLLLSIFSVLSGSFNPFIYFRF